MIPTTPPASSRQAWAPLLALLAAAGALALSGCAVLPPRGEVAATLAFVEGWEDTPLARIARASRPPGTLGTPGTHGTPGTPGTPGTADTLAEVPPTGVRLLPSSDHAFDARLALTRHATRTLDAQYYHVHADTAGATFLRELRDAALHGVRVRLLVDETLI